MRFSASFTLAAIAVAAASVKAESCSNKGEIMCGEDNTDLLLECDGENWSTRTCPSDQYCMTMNPSMIHCMLKPDNEGHSSSHETSSHETDSTTSSAWSLIANGMATVALAAAGLSAFF